MSAYARVDLEPAYILHARPYRETSQVLEVFTASYGRKGLVARGVRRPKSPWRGIIGPFQPLRLSWSGKGDLGTLREAELGGKALALDGDAVMAGFYVNELLMKLLHRHDPHTDLFAHYASLISSLTTEPAIEPGLRMFELELLDHIGYALNLKTDAIRHEVLVADQWYEYRIERGAIPVDHTAPDGMYFTGAELLAIGSSLDDPDETLLRNAKRLLRNVLDFHLGGKTLHTRRIAMAMRR